MSIAIISPCLTEYVIFWFCTSFLRQVPHRATSPTVLETDKVEGASILLIVVSTIRISITCLTQHIKYCCMDSSHATSTCSCDLSSHPQNRRSGRYSIDIIVVNPISISIIIISLCLTSSVNFICELFTCDKHLLVRPLQPSSKQTRWRVPYYNYKG